MNEIEAVVFEESIHKDEADEERKLEVTFLSHANPSPGGLPRCVANEHRSKAGRIELTLRVPLERYFSTWI